eukprot:1156632-Pelagomonas_calceolata.AAC.7
MKRKDKGQAKVLRNKPPRDPLNERAVRERNLRKGYIAVPAYEGSFDLVTLFNYCSGVAVVSKGKCASKQMSPRCKNLYSKEAHRGPNIAHPAMGSRRRACLSMPCLACCFLGFSLAHVA